MLKDPSSQALAFVEQALDLARGRESFMISLDENALSVLIDVDGWLHRFSPIACDADPAEIFRCLCKLVGITDPSPQEPGQEMTLRSRGAARKARVSWHTLSSGWVWSAAFSDVDRTLSLEQLGLEPADLQQWLGLLQSPTGLLVIGSSTGNGKTTALYASCRAAMSAGRTVATVERYPLRLQGASQLAARYQYDAVEVGSRPVFPDAIRQQMQSDADVLLVNRIRDPETARACLDASASRLVLAGLPTVDGSSCVGRLGVGGFDLPSPMLAERFLGTLSCFRRQRLCTRCRHLTEPSPLVRELLESHGLPISNWEANGCEHCWTQGERGATGVYTLAVPDVATRMAIQNDVDWQIKKLAFRNAGEQPLLRACLRRASAGEISFARAVELGGLA